jgi:hypothetical protein
MSMASLMAEAAAAVEARGRAYGPAEPMFSLVASRWSQVIGTTITPGQVVLCLIDLKLARLIHDPCHRDSQVDIAGYAALLREVTR